MVYDSSGLPDGRYHEHGSKIVALNKRVTTGTEQYSEANTLNFVVKNLISAVRTMTICRVLAVEFPEGQNIYGTVDLQPLIKRVDIDGNASSMPPIYNVPFLRLQGIGNSAIILNPKVGDIGIAIVSDRDITSVVATKQESNPGSNRQNSLSDSVYIGGILNGKPEQFIEFTDTEINIISPNNINLTAKNININADNITITGKTAINGDTSITGETDITGNLTVSGNITGANVSATGDVSDSAGKLSDLRSNYNAHKHQLSGVTAGSDTVTSGTPTN